MTLLISPDTRRRPRLVRIWLVRALLAVAGLPVLTGCQITDSRAKSLVITSLNNNPRQFILFGAGPYDGELTFALVEHGFAVKPIAIRQDIAEIEANRVVEYREAGFRYALELSWFTRAGAAYSLVRIA